MDRVHQYPDLRAPGARDDADARFTGVSRVTRALCAAAVLALGLTTTVSAQQTPAMPTVRVAMPPTDAASQGYYAQAKGFYKKVGLNVEILTINEGASVAAAQSARVTRETPVNLASASSRA